MPPMIRAILSVTVLAASAALWFVRQTISLEAPAELFFGLTAFMCLAVWLFPEVKRNGSGSR